MKKVFVNSLIGVVVTLIILAIVLHFTARTSKEYPFKVLKAEDIGKVELVVRPPDIETEISDNKQIQKLADILKEVVIYEEDDSWRDYSGQFVQYTITKKNGEIVTIGAYNPFLIIDSTGYKTKYQPCEDLNELANLVIQK